MTLVHPAHRGQAKPYVTYRERPWDKANCYAFAGNYTLFCQYSTTKRARNSDVEGEIEDEFCNCRTDLVFY